MKCLEICFIGYLEGEETSLDTKPKKILKVYFLTKT
jgi:hypothetical protein